MKLENIDKTRYRKHLNLVIVIFVLTFALLAILYGHLLIQFVALENESHFKFNVTGVIFAFITCVALLNRVKNHPFFTEIYYVWRLKQVTNAIFRKSKKYKKLASEGNETAMVILLFYYEGLTQQYELDDNTITMSAVNKERQQLENWINQYGVTINSAQFSKELLKQCG